MDQPSGRCEKFFVGATGLGLLIAALVESYTCVEGYVIIAFVAAGTLLVGASPLLPRLQKFKFSATGGEFEASPPNFAVGEYQASKGQVINAPEAIKAADATFAVEATATAGAEVTRGGEMPRVVVTQVAEEELALFSPSEREAIAKELQKVGSRDGNEYGLRWGLQPNRQYRARRVDEDIRIYFRQREKTVATEPDSFVVLGFQKANPEPGQQRLGHIPRR